MRIGLLGGTFDPPHVAHMVVAEAAFRQLELDHVTFLPAGIPWQKAGTPVTAARHRWGMTLATTSDIPYLEADNSEIARSGYSYTIDTLIELEGVIPTLILGADAAARIRSWHRSEEVLERARIAVAPRTGTARTAVEEAVGGSLDWLEIPALAISGTELRRRAAAGHSLRFLVREPVRSYILAHRLYMPSRASQRIDRQ
ncbi:MAG: nicotinate-nucleotide adenylyltransferase [bacterium]|nr:nicotinate-nucleotide adenylyltransferase [bacterium]MDE0290586.1 nicotinate-nucleotide adenylyltransferase [bacterium]MDE0437297.1 nicotinate-nucleotide adenylyltransferase [bacterium]